MDNRLGVRDVEFLRSRQYLSIIQKQRRRYTIVGRGKICQAYIFSHVWQFRILVQTPLPGMDRLPVAGEAVNHPASTHPGRIQSVDLKAEPQLVLLTENSVGLKQDLVAAVLKRP